MRPPRAAIALVWVWEAVVFAGVSSGFWACAGMIVVDTRADRL
ncbi:MAG: hypothetical protein QOG21_2056 [Actinomycetota bacterium]|jgi:hypothetical protein|nr:hypothetical protein [Actinomycetota bacterium]